MKKFFSVLIALCLLALPMLSTMALTTITLTAPKINAADAMVDVYHVEDAGSDVSFHSVFPAGTPFSTVQEKYADYSCTLVGSYIEYNISVSGLPEGWLWSSSEVQLSIDSTKLKVAYTNDKLGKLTFAANDWMYNSVGDRYLFAVAHGKGASARNPFITLYLETVGEIETTTEVAVNVQLFRGSYVNTEEEVINVTEYLNMKESGSITLTKNYNVKYMADDTLVAEYSVPEGKTLAEIPAVPEKEGFTGAWDTDLTGVEITEDKTVNAVYTVKTYDVKYMVDGEVFRSYSVEHGKTLTEIPAVPEKEGFTGKWDADLTGVAITGSKTVNAVYTSLVKYGDANVDGNITASDAAAILRHLVDIEKLSEQGLLNADCDGKAGLSASDAAAILRFLVDLETALPVVL